MQAALIQRPFYYAALAADPTNAEVVYAGPVTRYVVDLAAERKWNIARCTTPASRRPWVSASTADVA